MPPDLKRGEEARARRDRLCQQCRGISAEQLARPNGCAHHATLQNWISFAVSCRLCHLFWHEFRRHRSDGEGYKIIASNPRVPKLGYALQATEDDKFQRTHQLRIQLNEGEDKCRLIATNFTNIQYSANLPERDISLTYVEIFTDENHPALAPGVPFRRTQFTEHWSREFDACSPSLAVTVSRITL